MRLPPPPATEPTTSWRLDAAEYVALWRRLGLGDRPVLLEVPDHGDTYAARDAADRAALGRLQRAGTLDAAGHAVPLLADALAVLAVPVQELDARSWTDGARTARLVAGDGHLAVAAHLDADRALHLHISVAVPRPGPAPADLLLAALPEHPPLPGSPLALPAAAVLGGGAAGRHARLRAARVPADVLVRLDALFAAPPRRVLQIGGAYRGRDGRRRRAPSVLTVVDAVPGRVLVRHVDDRVELRPLDHGALRRQLLALGAAGPATSEPG